MRKASQKTQRVMQHSFVAACSLECAHETTHTRAGQCLRLLTGAWVFCAAFGECFAGNLVVHPKSW